MAWLRETKPVTNGIKCVKITNAYLNGEGNMEKYNARKKKIKQRERKTKFQEDFDRIKLMSPRI